MDRSFGGAAGGAAAGGPGSAGGGPRRVRAGVGPQGQRDHNDRLILSTLQRAGPLPGADLARRAGLSSQAVSVILRRLEAEGLVERGAPQRGRVGKPRVPVGLAPGGVLSVGMMIGRRNADLLLADFTGGVRGQLQLLYRWPEPAAVLAFLREGLDLLLAPLAPAERARVAGIGIARPYHVWDWDEVIGAPKGGLDGWRDLDLPAEVARICDLPVHLVNDGTAAARAEHVHGGGRAFRDFAYVFVGSFVGGGVVLDHSVFEGAFGNAGAVGSIPIRDAAGRERQLIDAASLFVLEEALARAGIDAAGLWARPQDWSGFGAVLEGWLGEAAAQLARAAVTACAVIDFEAVVIDGALPEAVRARLVGLVRDEVARLDTRGLSPVRIVEGRVGRNARALGAAAGPIFARHLLNTHGEAGG